MIYGFFHQGQVNHITGDVFYLALFMSKRKTIITYHDCNPLWLVRGFRKWIIFLFWYWLPSRFCRRITAVSQFTKGEFIRYTKCDPDKVQVIHNSVDDVFKKNLKIFNKKKPKIIQIGTDFRKNLGRVIIALEGIPCHFRIIGGLKKEEIQSLRRRSIVYSNSPYMPHSEIFQEISQCDILVFASIYEGFGLPVIEANAVGRPVVTSNIGPIPEVAGNAACLVDPYDPQSIRKGILKVIQDSAYRGQLIENGYQNTQRFNPRKIANQYADLYKEIASGISNS